jgi:hypothetical protein
MQASAGTRLSVNLTDYPDLVVVLLGFKVRRLRGLKTILKIGRGLRVIQGDPPDGLLADEQLFFGLTHIGIRQYWRNLDSLEQFTRSEPHASWWRTYMRDQGGAGFWHETYCRRGGMEAIYVNMPGLMGFGRFAEPLQPTGPFLSARARLAD